MSLTALAYSEHGYQEIQIDRMEKVLPLANNSANTCIAITPAMTKPMPMTADVSGFSERRWFPRSPENDAYS